MKIYVTFFNVQTMKSKTKFAKVYGKGEDAYILYKGSHVPVKDLAVVGHDDVVGTHYSLNTFGYFYNKN